jgi:hypothetical protein
VVHQKNDGNDQVGNDDDGQEKMVRRIESTMILEALRL